MANKFLLGDSNHARHSLGRHGGMLGSTNDASIQPYQGFKGVQETIRRNQHVYQPFAPSGGAHLTSWANGTPAHPATMVMSASTGNGGSSKRHYHFGLQAANAHLPSDGPVHLGPPPASSIDVTAYSSYPYNFCPLSNSWAATPFDVWVPRPTAQAVASQMNIVTPYTSYGHDGGMTSVGAAVGVAASSALGPTRNIASACDTALSDWSDAVRGYRSPHRCVSYDQTHAVPTRRAPRTSRPRATRGPVVQFEADPNALATRLLNEGADSTAVQHLCSQIFNNEVSARALTVKSICREQSTSTSSTRSKYRLLLADVERKDGSNGYCCLLCPQGRRKEYKNPQDSIRHLRKAHFGISARCFGGWYVGISRFKPQSKEN